MTDNEIIKALNYCGGNIKNNDEECNEDMCYQVNLPESRDEGARWCRQWLIKDALELINRQKAEIVRLNKNYEELIYKTECLLCHATGNKFSKYTYTTQEMLSFVDDYIQDCCDEVIEETKATAKSEAIKEFIDELKNRVINKYEYTDIRVFKEIYNLVKEMTEIETNQRKEDEGK